MYNSIIETITTNKMTIIKRGLIIGGVLIGLGLAGKAILKSKGEVEDAVETVVETENEESTGV